MPLSSPTASLQGRFELRRVLDTASASAVWIGFDLRREREVLVEFFNAAALDDDVALQAWLVGVRRTRGLVHRNIAPVVAADVHDGLTCPLPAIPT